MAVYLCDEYFEEYPNRIKSKGVFDKFALTAKNLHEMSVDEVNEVTAGWGKFASATANKMRKEIKLYYDWLSEKGYDVDTEMYKKMDIPIKANEYLIYSTDTLRYYWKTILDAMEKYAKARNRGFSRDSYLVNIVACILRFYGMTIEEIFELPRWDVTENGIKGYDFNIKKEDLDILIKYRDLKELQNRMTLTGDKYIRSGRNDSNIPRDFLTASIRKSDNVSDEFKYLKSYLTDTYCYKMGLFYRAYEYEIKNNTSVDEKRNIPQWFINIMCNPTQGKLLVLKNEYLEYRAERRKSNEKDITHSESVIIEEKINPVIEKSKESIINIEILKMFKSELEIVLNDLHENERKIKELLKQIDNYI